ncbi:hypothetical protein AMECASPLE_033725 [Ameca splendens]|uniref:Uncharacterized protein n=1 Tax=Ameca splendens TaxID=208324 RepID=A0ABV0YIB8_9TELE
MCCRSSDISPTIHVTNRRQRSSRFTAPLKRRSFYLLLVGFNSTWRTWILQSESRRFIYGKLNNAAVIDVSGFTKFSRDGTSLESTTTYSRSSVWMMVAFSGTSIYPGPSLTTCCSTLGDESDSRTPTGAVSPLQNACPSIFGKGWAYNTSLENKEGQVCTWRAGFT